MFERFTRDARGVVLAAIGEAERRGDRHVGTEHLLLGLVASPQAVTSRVITDHELDLHAARRALDAADAAALRAVGLDVTALLDLPDGPRRRWRRRLDHMPFTSGAKHTLEDSLREALALGHRHIGAEHVLLALCARELPDPGGHLLTSLGTSPARLRADLLRRLLIAA